MDILDKELEFETFVNTYQVTFFQTIQKYETKFQPIKDSWVRSDNKGYGLSCIIQNGSFFEKAGVNTTRLTIPVSKSLASLMSSRPNKQHLSTELSLENLGNYELYANGVSLVIHPINPYIPTVHANFRFMRIKHKETGDILEEWFGGGCDLTPNYLFEEDAITYHQSIKDACIQATENGAQLYDQFKDDCDKYFYIPHRKEGRGVGGVFYDDFSLESFEAGMNFSSKIAYANLNAYETILRRRMDMEFGEQEEHWKQYRRGRYVEFNLVYDRGTKFGLLTPEVRIESVLMSLPLIARWEYMREIEKGSREDQLMEVLKNPRKWV